MKGRCALAARKGCHGQREAGQRQARICSSKGHHRPQKASFRAAGRVREQLFLAKVIFGCSANMRPAHLLASCSSTPKHPILQQHSLSNSSILQQHQGPLSTTPARPAHVCSPPQLHISNQGLFLTEVWQQQQQQQYHCCLASLCSLLWLQRVISAHPREHSPTGTAAAVHSVARLHRRCWQSIPAGPAARTHVPAAPLPAVAVVAAAAHAAGLVESVAKEAMQEAATKGLGWLQVSCTFCPSTDRTKAVEGSDAERSLELEDRSDEHKGR